MELARSEQEWEERGEMPQQGVPVVDGDGLHVLHRVALRRGGDARAEVSRRR